MKISIELPKPLDDFLKTNNVISLSNWDKAKELFPQNAGLYAFWWRGDTGILEDHAVVQFVGPAIKDGHNNHQCSFIINDKDRLLTCDQLPHKATCLYVGKSTNIRQRVNKHLMPGLKTSTAYLSVKDAKTGEKTRTDKYDVGISTVFKRNSSSQFRAGMEYLFRHRSKANPELVWKNINSNVFVTFLSLADSEIETEAHNTAFKRRFYWEDLLIGILQPWFNLDGER